MSRAIATIHGLDLACEFSHFRAYAATLEQPGEAERVEVDSCCLGGVEITALIAEDCMFEIERQLLQSVHDERERQECDRADRKEYGMEAWIAAGHTTD